ncbi:MAG TPA: M10 family metallopeptidase [Burkholderiales bacterium]
MAVSFSFPGAGAVWSTDPVSGYGSSPGSGEPWNAFTALTAPQQQGARAALQAWSGVANVTFSEVAETASAVGDIRFGFTSAVLPGSAAHAYLPGGTFNPVTGIGTAYAKTGDIWIDSSSAPTFNPVVGSFDFGTLLHEIGHALGLKHPFEVNGAFGTLPPGEDSTQYSVMSYTNHPHSLFRDVQATPGGFSWSYFNVQPSTPMLYDILAMQHLYGPNLGAHTGNDTYTYSTTTPFFATIWDAGGIDTVSVANFTESCTIDLRAGHFSSIRILSDPLPPGAVDPTIATYDGTDNLAIAFGVVIENATGGAGADFLIGNTAGNILNGGAGADVMEGGAGNDVYVVNRAGDTVNEAAGEGSDTIRSSVALVLPVNVEGLVLLGSADLAGVGNNGANTIAGNSGINALNGAAGVDTVTYVSAPAGVIVNLLSGQATGWGADSLKNFEDVVGSNFADQITGSAGSNLIEGRAGDDTLDGGSGVDTVSYASSASGVSVDLATGQATGGAGNDALAGFESVIGSANSDTIAGNAANNTLNGGAGPDILRGDAGNDVLVYDAMDVQILGGAGTDTLAIPGSGVTMNLSGTSGSILVDIERIDLSGTGTNTLTLTAADVLALSTTSDRLVVLGNVGDVLNAGAGWAPGSLQTVGSQSYQGYTQGLAMLLVDTDITRNVAA